jgi:hypothetical protein
MSITLRTNGSVVITDAIPVKQFGKVKQWTTKITIREMGEMYDRITYDPETNRGLKADGHDMIDKKHVNNMYNVIMRENHGLCGDMTLNIRGDGFEATPPKNSDMQVLIIDANQIITIPDSAHRREVFKKIYESGKNSERLDDEYVLNVHNMTINEEQVFFAEINGAIKRPCNNRIAALNRNNPNSITHCLTRELIENVGIKVDYVNNATAYNKITKFSTFHDALFKRCGAYEKTDINSEYNRLLEWLTEFYTELLSTRVEFQDVERKQVYKLETMALEEIMWWGYSAISKELIGVPNWVKILNKAMDAREQGMDWMDKRLKRWQTAAAIRPSYDKDGKKIDGTGVINSWVTRGRMATQGKIHIQTYIKKHIGSEKKRQR